MREYSPGTAHRAFIGHGVTQNVVLKFDRRSGIGNYQRLKNYSAGRAITGTASTMATTRRRHVAITATLGTSSHW
jgi:hypothetical protein